MGPGPVSLRAAGTALGTILFRPLPVRWPVGLLVAAAIVVSVRFRRDPLVLAATVGPLLCAVAGFAFWQGGYDTYWFLMVAPSAALSIGLAVTAWRPVATIASAALLLLIAVAQPARSAESLTMHRLPEYGALVRGSREVKKYASEVQAVRAAFPLPTSTEPDYLYQLLGGRISPTARYIATIDRRGRANFSVADPWSSAPTTGE